MTYPTVELSLGPDPDPGRDVDLIYLFMLEQTMATVITEGNRYSRAGRIQAELALMREEGEQPVWDELAASGKWPGVTG